MLDTYGEKGNVTSWPANRYYGTGVVQTARTDAVRRRRAGLKTEPICTVRVRKNQIQIKEEAC